NKIYFTKFVDIQIKGWDQYIIISKNKFLNYLEYCDSPIQSPVIILILHYIDSRNFSEHVTIINLVEAFTLFTISNGNYLFLVQEVNNEINKDLFLVFLNNIHSQEFHLENINHMQIYIMYLLSVFKKIFSIFA